MRFDTNTNGHMQWFYFSVKNSKKGRVKFNLFRFRKVYSLYQRGFRPYSRSKKRGETWLPAGQNVKYLREMTANEHGVKKYSGFYFLSFNYCFQFQNDEVFFAACIPYSTTYLQKRLDFLSEKFSSQIVTCERLPLCSSLCGMTIQYLSIEPRQDPHRPRPRQFIVINARSHPGETSSSWVTDGLLESLLLDPSAHQWMVETNTCFRVVPMLNKDGVFMGNYRTGVVGQDFNRRFCSGQRQFFPQIAALKRLVNKCQKLGTVRLFLDIHGHSILKNSFIFGPDRRTFFSQPLLSLGDVLSNSSKYFSQCSSRYSNQKSKIETARIYFQMEEGLPSLTCQNSLGLFYENYQTFQFTQVDWQTFGRHILLAIQKSLSQPQFYSFAPPSKPKASRNKQTLNSIKIAERRATLLPNPISTTHIVQKPSATINKALPLTKYPQKRPSVSREKNNTTINNTAVNNTHWYISKEKRSIRRSKKEEKNEKNNQSIQKSVVLTRYGESKSLYEEERGSLADQPETTSANRDPIAELMGEEQAIPQNFSEEYVSMNDSDPEEDDIDSSKRQELFKCIKQLSSCPLPEQGADHLLSKEELVPVKGFKQYKLNLEEEQVFSPEKKQPASRLRPLKYQEFRMRGMTQKKIKGNIEILMDNHSMLTSQREKSRIASKNEALQKKAKEAKKEQLITEIFPHMEENEYLLMRIKEIKLSSTHNKDPRK